MVCPRRPPRFEAPRSQTDQRLRRSVGVLRYDLASAPVVDTNGKLVGRVTADEILDFVRERGEDEMLARTASSWGWRR